MSHRRYGKPVRLDCKAPLSLSVPLSAGVFSATLSSLRPFASPPSLRAVSTFLPVLRLSLAFPPPLIRVLFFIEILAERSSLAAFLSTDHRFDGKTS